MSITSTSEFICVVIHTIIVLFSIPIGWLLILSCLYLGSYYRFFALSYLVFLYFDWDIRDYGGRYWYFVRSSWYFKKIRSFYSIRLKSDYKYNSGVNYIVGFHPHGLFCVGFNSSYDERSKDFLEVFGEGFRAVSAAADYDFIAPIEREYFLGFGAINASEKSLKYWLQHPAGGRLLLLAVGGAAESNFTQTEEYSIILHKRKGFCRIAIETGSHLIPSFTFGENETFQTFKGTEKLRSLQKAFTKVTGIGFPLTTFIPQRTPVTVVLGEAIQVTKNPRPSREEVAELHAKYVAALQELFEKHKEKYYPKLNAKLVIVE